MLLKITACMLLWYRQKCPQHNSAHLWLSLAKTVGSWIPANPDRSDLGRLAGIQEFSTRSAGSHPTGRDSAFPSPKRSDLTQPAGIRPFPRQNGRILANRSRSGRSWPDRPDLIGWLRSSRSG
jgi:hypothetical protein